MKTELIKRACDIASDAHNTLRVLAVAGAQHIPPDDFGLFAKNGFDGDRLGELVGRRVMLDEMPDDPHPILPGSTGTVIGIDDRRTIHVRWDDGRTLSLLPGIDKYHII